MKTLRIGLLAMFMLAMSHVSFGQAFSKGNINMSVTLGASHFWHLRGSYYNPGWGYGWGWGHRSPVSGNLLFTMEFAPGRYVGAGFFAGIGGSALGYGSLNVPVGGFANFHFYQLIADKTSKNIHADKLDIYAGLNIGTGLGFWPGFPDHRANAIIFGGPTVGARYYFNPNFGVTAEMGYGKTIFSAGVTFKM